MTVLSRALVICVLGALVLPAAVVALQQPAEEAPSAAERAPRPIDLSAIPRLSEEARSRLDAIEASLETDPGVEAITSELPAWSERLDATRSSASRRPVSEMSLRELTDAQSQWQAFEAQTDTWLGALESRSTELASYLEEIGDLTEVWTITGQESSGDAPDGVREGIERLLAEAARVQDSVQERLDAVLTLEDAITERAGPVQDSLERVGVALGELRESLFEVDAPPLWAALSSDETRASLVLEATESLTQTWASTRRYVASSMDRFAAQLLTFLALLWLFIQLHKRSDRWREQEGLEASVRELSHPVANALLVTLLVTRLFHPRAPLGLFELNRLAIIIPVLTILPGLVYSSMRVALYSLAGLYVADALVELLPAQALLTRLMQLGLSGAALAGVLWLARPGGIASRLELGRFWRAGIVMSRLGALLLGISIVANILGRVRLSTLLTNATLTSAYAAVALFAGTLILQGLWTLLLETRLSRSIRSVSTKLDLVRGLGVKLVHLVAIVTWTAFTLGSFQLLDPVLAWTVEVFGATLSVGELEISLGDVLALVVTIYLSFVISRIARVVLEEDVLPQFTLPRGVPSTISMLANYAILLIGLVIALAAAGIQMSQFALLAGAFGVGIGFGLQNIVNNFISGLILLFERPIQIGDNIELESLLGKVSRIGIRSSTVRTFEGAEVIVPNAHLIDSKVINWTLSDRLRRIEVTVGVAYGSRPKAVLETLLEVARKHEEILDEPAPYVLFEGFGDSSLDFVLRAWTGNFDDFLRIRSELRVGVHDALEKAGFVIPFPQRDLHVKTLPEEAEGVVPSKTNEHIEPTGDEEVHDPSPLERREAR